MRGISSSLIVMSVPLLSCCTAELSYTTYSEGQDIPAGAVHFALQSSAITFDASKSGNSSLGSPPAPSTQKTQDNCPKGTTVANWWACWNGVTPQLVVAPSKGDTYLANPVKTLFGFSETKANGTPLTTSDILYKTITITYADNSKAVITSVGSDASAGFGIAGPYGALVGGAIGLLGGEFRENAIPPETAISISDLVCPASAALIDYSGAVRAPHLFLPAMFDSTDAKPFGYQSAIAKDFKAPGACWHALTNNAQLGHPHPVPAADPAKPAVSAQALADGDGWFYRVVTADDPDKPPAGTVPVKAYFDPTVGRQSSFPYSSCRDMTVQVTSLPALNNAIAKYNSGDDAQPNPLMIPYATKIADPAFVGKAKFDDSATITFKTDCGAYATITGDASASGGIDAFFTQAQALDKAQKAAAPTPAKKN